VIPPEPSSPTLTEPASGPAGPRISRQVYVAAYSSIELSSRPTRTRPTAIARPPSEEIPLSVTLSIRNVSQRHPLFVDSVRYYDSVGRQIRQFVPSPVELPPLATTEFLIDTWDLSGGSGANFLVAWSGVPDIDEPLIEAVMIGHSAGAGFAFTSSGRVVASDGSD
jgi:hypothetical protein